MIDIAARGALSVAMLRLTIVVLAMLLATPAFAEAGRLAGLENLLSRIESVSVWSPSPLSPADQINRPQIRLVELLSAASPAELDSVGPDTIDRITNLLAWPNTRETAAIALKALGARAGRAIPQLRAAITADCRRSGALAAQGAHVNAGAPNFAAIGDDALRTITRQAGPTPANVCSRY